MHVNVLNSAVGVQEDLPLSGVPVRTISRGIFDIEHYAGVSEQLKQDQKMKTFAYKLEMVPVVETPDKHILDIHCAWCGMKCPHCNDWEKRSDDPFRCNIRSSLIGNYIRDHAHELEAVRIIGPRVFEIPTMYLREISYWTSENKLRLFGESNGIGSQNLCNSFTDAVTDFCVHIHGPVGTYYKWFGYTLEQYTNNELAAHLVNDTVSNLDSAMHVINTVFKAREEDSNLPVYFRNLRNLRIQTRVSKALHPTCDLERIKTDWIPDSLLKYWVLVPAVAVEGQDEYTHEELQIIADALGCKVEFQTEKGNQNE